MLLHNLITVAVYYVLQESVLAFVTHIAISTYVQHSHSLAYCLNTKDNSAERTSFHYEMMVKKLKLVYNSHI